MSDSGDKHHLIDVAKDILSLLDSTLIIGGMAVSIYGHTRYTEDIDLATDLSKTNAMNLLANHCDDLTCNTGDMLEPLPWVIHGKKDGIAFQVLPAKSICIDVNHGVHIANGALSFASLDDLMQSKCIAGGHQDLCDVAILSMLNKGYHDKATNYAEKHGCLDKLKLWMSDERLIQRYQKL